MDYIRKGGLDKERFLKLVFLTLFGSLVFLSSANGQSLQREILRLHELQKKGDYDSALQLANRLLQSGELSEEKRLQVWLTKPYSFYYSGKYDSLRGSIPLLEKEIPPKDPLYPEFLLVRALAQGEDASYREAI